MIAYRTHRLWRTITTKWWRSFTIIIAVTIGVGIAIAIVAAGEGSKERINELLPAHSSRDLQARGINLPTIQLVLSDVCKLLLGLSTIYTVASVAMVVGASVPQRRREISIDRQEGQYHLAIMFELGVEAFILCVTGGLLGILLGRVLCRLIMWLKPSLPMLPTPSFGGVAFVFSITVVTTFCVTFLMAFFPARTFRDPDR